MSTAVILTLESPETLSSGQQLSSYLAVGIAEGFEPCDNEEDWIKAWSYIGRHKLYLHLQGWFGRTLMDIVNSGLLDENFNIL